MQCVVNDSVVLRHILFLHDDLVLVRSEDRAGSIAWESERVPANIGDQGANFVLMLGIDVHDVADYAMPLAPGMVITVEPGIYLPDSGIGVRIEDDVLVTDRGHRVLSEDIPRERAAVEKWIQAARR